MAKISGIQKEYVEAFEKLKENKVDLRIVSVSEMNYDRKQELREYKLDPSKRAENYDGRIDSCYKYMLTTFYTVDDASPIYETFKNLFAVVYLDNTDDDTNDYSDKTMAKLNRLYSYINGLGDQDLTGTELLYLIQKEIIKKRSKFDKPLADTTLDTMFAQLQIKCEQMQLSGNAAVKLAETEHFLEMVAETERYLFGKKFFYHDYRKSVTCLVNYLFSKAGVPQMHIKPIELDEYYKCASSNNNQDLVTFYKEKICDSVEDALIVPMKKIIKSSFDASVTSSITREFNPAALGLRLD